MYMGLLQATEQPTALLRPLKRYQGVIKSTNAVMKMASSLSILEAPHLNDELGGILSSSRIRRGLIDQDGHPWIPPSYEGKILRMPDVLDDDFKTPMGELFEGPEDAPEVALSAMLEALPPNRGHLSQLEM